MTKLSYNDAPHDWALCFQVDCPLKTTCLRFAVGQLMPTSVTHHETVLPAARQEGTCQLYADARPTMMARGMKELFAGLEQRQAVNLRRQIVNIFGSRTHFYRYRNGTYPITPTQQKRIADIFKRNGITKPVAFDEAREAYFFPKP